MSHNIQCPDCGRRFSQDELYMDHLVREHQVRLREYLTEKSPVISCPGGCGSLFDVKNLNASTICPNCTYKVGYNRFRWAAKFVAANDIGKQKEL